ncbi:MAG: acyl-CoA desaturase [Leptospiraceae bacterium]|nr:acyl-CoA desaturase [Leptospiraceae bacterium]
MEATVEKKSKLRIFSLVLFILISLTPLFAFFVPFSWDLLALAVGLYFFRMFGITAVYHRYFSHNSYKTSRVMQFILAWIGAMAMQKGPIWWAAHHRNHHKYSDTELDLHSPRKGFWHSHMLWFLKSGYDEYDPKIIKDYTKYPELVWLDKYYWIPPLLFSIGLGMISFPVLVWGYGVSNFFAGHATWTINSLAHVIGKQRYETGDDSKNHWLLAIITMGEGWHNNHHHYRHSSNMGFYWYEIDLSYYILKLMSFVGLIWDLKSPPEHVLELGLKNDAIAKGKTKYKNMKGEWININEETPLSPKPAFASAKTQTA